MRVLVFVKGVPIVDKRLSISFKALAPLLITSVHCVKKVGSRSSDPLPTTHLKLLRPYHWISFTTDMLSHASDSDLVTFELLASL